VSKLHWKILLGYLLWLSIANRSKSFTKSNYFTRYKIKNVCEAAMRETRPYVGVMRACVIHNTRMSSTDARWPLTDSDWGLLGWPLSWLTSSGHWRKMIEDSRPQTSSEIWTTSDVVWFKLKESSLKGRRKFRRQLAANFIFSALSS